MKASFFNKCNIVLGKDFFLLMFDIRKRFLPDTKVHIFQPAVIMDFLKLKKPQPNNKKPALRDLLAYYFALRQDQFYLLFKAEVCLASL